MRKFLLKVCLVLVLFVVANVLLLWLIPKDGNAYECAYNQKIALLESTPSPRIILLGGSTVAFGTDSKRIIDSLGYPVVNFGLNKGVGIRYLMDDYLQYVRPGDVVVLQIEYDNFFNGGNGNYRDLTQLLIATDYRNLDRLNWHQWVNAVEGVPAAVIGNINRLVKYPIRRTWDKPSNGNVFFCDGFNEYGDEVNHLAFKGVGAKATGRRETREVDADFLSWFNTVVRQYEEAGAKVIMMPPVDVQTCFKEYYNDHIETALKSINRWYVVEPEYMVLDDSCSYDGGSHVTKEGVRQNTDHLIGILRKQL